MVTQKIVTRLSNDVLPPVRMVSGDVGREIQLEIYANDESLAPIDLETYSARITIIKPDKTFVIQDFDNDKVELPEQAGAVTGHGYYQIKIYTAGDHQIYTGQGPFIVDDDVLSEEMIESVAEVNGYEFPDDFLTDADLREYVTKYELEDALAGIIDDDTTDYNSTWSSAKISDLLSTVSKTATGNPIEISDGADAPLVKCTTSITGSQDLNGYDKPWVGGAGKNKFDGNYQNINAGIQYRAIYLGSGTFTMSTTCPETTSTAANLFFLSGNVSSGASTSSNGVSRYVPRTVTAVDGYVTVAYRSNEGVNPQDYNTQIESGSTATSYEPYSNLCPITAYTEVEIEVSDGDGNTTTHTTTFPSAIYRGSEDCVKGEVTSEWVKIKISNLSWSKQGGNYASFVSYSLTNLIQKSSSEIVAICDSFQAVSANTAVQFQNQIYANASGELKIGDWAYSDASVSDWLAIRGDVEIAYRLATPTTSSVTPTNPPIKSLSGYSHIESSTGDMEVEYIVETYDAIMKAAQLDNMKVYSTAEQVVGKWIDGTTDVYEKTFVIEPASPPMDWVGFFTVNMAALVSVEGYTVYNASGQSAYTTLYDTYYGCRFAYNPAIARGQLCYYYDNGDITKIVVTVRYTKGV